MAIPETSRVIGDKLFRPVFGSISELPQHLPLSIPESPLLVPLFWVERRHLLATRSTARICGMRLSTPGGQLQRCVVSTELVQTSRSANREIA